MSSTIHKTTANSESFTPVRKALQSPCSLRRPERGLLAAPTAPLLPLSFLPSVTHTLPLTLHFLPDAFSHAFSLSCIHFLTDADNPVLFTPATPPHTHLLPIALQIKPSLFPQPRRPLPPGVWPPPTSSSGAPLAHPPHPPGFPTSGPSALAFARGLLPASPLAGSFSWLGLAIITDLPFYPPFPHSTLTTTCDYLTCLLVFLDYKPLRMGTFSVMFFAVSLGLSVEAGM